VRFTRDNPIVRRALALLGLAVAAAGAPSASGSPNDGVAIRLGVGIGPINIGMSGQQVRRALGEPRAVMQRRVLRGQPYVEFEWNYGDWWVGLIGRRGARRVVLIGTALSRYRTTEGHGVGTTETRLWRELRGRLRERRCHPSDHWYMRHGQRETIFFRLWQPEPKPVIVGRVEVRREPALGCNV
jgi:hypothetical protein